MSIEVIKAAEWIDEMAEVPPDAWPKSEALRLADALEEKEYPPRRAAAAELRRLEAAVAAEREKVAAWMIERSYATGHGDTTEDLLKELEWQIRESEREACAKVCDDLVLHQYSASGCAAAIRARGEKT